MSEKQGKYGSRFDALMKNVAKADQHIVSDEPEQEPADRQLAKNKDPNYQRTTLYLPKSLHRKLKAAAANSDREMSDIMQELIEQWLGSNPDV
jgi:hypothetical protein